MSALVRLAASAAEATTAPPTWLFGAGALAVLAVLGLVVLSYRDVYHRHAKSERPVAEPSHESASHHS